MRDGDCFEARVCAAIQGRRCIRFSYHGTHRMAIPCAHGTLTTGHEALRAHEVVGGQVRPGKLFLLGDLEDVEVCAEGFAKPPPHYHRDDRAMRSIHCQL